MSQMFLNLIINLNRYNKKYTVYDNAFNRTYMKYITEIKIAQLKKVQE